MSNNFEDIGSGSNSSPKNQIGKKAFEDINGPIKIPEGPKKEKSKDQATKNEAVKKINEEKEKSIVEEIKKYKDSLKSTTHTKQFEDFEKNDASPKNQIGKKTFEDINGPIKIPEGPKKEKKEEIIDENKEEQEEIAEEIEVEEPEVVAQETETKAETKDKEIIGGDQSVGTKIGWKRLLGKMDEAIKKTTAQEEKGIIEEIKKYKDSLGEEERKSLDQSIASENKKLIGEYNQEGKFVRIIEKNNKPEEKKETLEEKTGEPTEKAEEAPEEKEEKVVKSLSPKNNQLYEKMSPKGKNIFQKAYEGLGLDRVVGKMKIGYEQFWIDKNEKKAINLKDQINGIDAKLSAFQQAEKEVLDLKKDFEKQEIYSPGSLELKLKEMDREKRDLLNEKDKVISKFEKHEDKVKLFTNKRDEIANRFIEKYGEKLKPIDKKLNELEESKDELDLAEAVNKAINKDLERKIKESEIKIDKIKETLRKTGMSEREINNFPQIEILQDLIDGGNEKIIKQRRELAEKKFEIEKKIARANIDYNKQNDKMQEFIRTKEDRPIDIKAPERNTSGEYTGTETIKRQERKEHKEETPPRRIYKDYEYGNEEEEVSEEEEENEIEDEEEGREKFTISTYISKWNNYLKEEYKDESKKEIINLKDFIKRIKLLKEDSELEYDNFKEILIKYCKLKKMSKEKIEKNMDTFFKERMQTKN